ncbi:MAG TPA: DUF4116 domain-containing protein [Anaerovoracaceae bacterium]|nr:DUF4116 domain-containing protein [Anaerovoracaceae bacterium]
MTHYNQTIDSSSENEEIHVNWGNSLKTTDTKEREIVNNKIDWKNKDQVLERLAYADAPFYYASLELKGDREVVLAAIQNNPFHIQYARNNLNDDKELCLVAVSAKGAALEYVSTRLSNDREIVLCAIKNGGDTEFKYASPEIRDDKEFVMEVITTVEHTGYLSQYLSDRLKNDKDIALETVKRNGLSLANFSEDVRNDWYIVSEAIKHNKSAVIYMGNEIRREIDAAATDYLDYFRDKVFFEQKLRDLLPEKIKDIKSPMDLRDSLTESASQPPMVNGATRTRSNKLKI